MKVATAQQDWWEFVQCLNFEGRDHVGDEGVSSKCAEITNIPWENVVEDGKVIRRGLQECIQNPSYGLKLLKTSVKNTAGLGIR
jgi:hypothetical protein